MVLITWTVKEILKFRLLSLEDDSYVKKLHTIAGELNLEDVCVPFILGLLAGLVFLIVLKVLRCCLARFCCRRSVNRIGGNYKGRLINKRNPLDETHLLLVSHQDLSDQEVWESIAKCERRCEFFLTGNSRRTICRRTKKPSNKRWARIRSTGSPCLLWLLNNLRPRSPRIFDCDMIENCFDCLFGCTESVLQIL